MLHTPPACCKGWESTTSKNRIKNHLGKVGPRVRRPYALFVETGGSPWFIFRGGAGASSSERACRNRLGRSSNSRARSEKFCENDADILFSHVKRVRYPSCIRLECGIRRGIHLECGIRRGIRLVSGRCCASFFNLVDGCQLLVDVVPASGRCCASFWSIPSRFPA